MSLAGAAAGESPAATRPQTYRSLLGRAGEDTCPYVACGGYGNSSVISLAFCFPMLVRVWVAPPVAQSTSPALS